MGLSVKELVWLGTSKKDLMQFPKEVTQEIGYALYVTQKGGCYHKPKPFKGLGSGVYEIAMAYDTNAYRTVYIVNRGNTIYVTHCFQKKSKRGIKTPKEDIAIIKQCLQLLKELIKKG